MYGSQMVRCVSVSVRVQNAATGELARQNSAEEPAPLSAENKNPSYMDIVSTQPPKTLVKVSGSAAS